MSLIFLSCAWVAGIILGSNFNVPLVSLVFGLAPLLLVFITRRHRKEVVLTGLCLIAFFGGAYYYGSSLPPADESHLRFYNDRGTLELKGLVDRDPDVRDKNTRLHLSVFEIKLDEGWHEVSGTALVFVPRYPSYRYGDVLLVEGKLETPFKDDDFDYENYLAQKGIYSNVFYPDIEVLETGRGLKFLEWVYSFRNSLSRTIGEVLPEPQASLTQGVVLGMRGNIPLSVKTDFTGTGTAHLLAISGLHLSIVAGILISSGVRIFGRKGYIYVWLALGVVWMYAILTGMNPPVLRAAIMVSMFLAAELLGRQRSAITALFFAAAVMVGISPHILWDASFQLSFAAMTGLIFIFPLIQTLCRRLISPVLEESGVAFSLAVLIADSFSVSLGAVIAVWPLIAYYFGIISPVGPVATFFALPALPGIIATGAVSAVLGLIFIPAAQAVAWLTWLFASYMLFVVNIFSAVPFIAGETVNGVLIWIYYLVLAAVIWLFHKRKKVVESFPPVDSFISILSRKWLVPVLLVVAVLVWAVAITLPDGRLQVSFLDVGQGDAVLIQKGNRQILIDGGPSPQAIALELSEEMPFWDRTIDLVILTHPHSDHITGLVEVLNRYSVKQVLYPDLVLESSLYDELLDLLEEKNIGRTLACVGQRIDFGSGVTLEVLNPQASLLIGTDSDIDNNGIVLRLSLEEVSFLLTADIMWETEYGLITGRAGLASTVLKVAHHGSATSTTTEFLEVVGPQIAVISVGEGNPHGHPVDLVLDRLEAAVGTRNIYRTDVNGTVEFITDGIRLWVKTDG